MASQIKAPERISGFYANRRRALIVMVACAFSQSVMLGSSSLVAAVDKRFSPDHERGDRSYVFNGVYAFSFSGMAATFIMGLWLLQLFIQHPERRKTVSLILLAAQPLAWLLMGVACAANYNVPLLYVSVVLLVGLNSALLDMVFRIQGLVWYAVDDTKNIGLAWIGTATGVGVIWYTLLSGWAILRAESKRSRRGASTQLSASTQVIHYGSLQTYFFVLAAFQLLTEIPIFLGITRGWLDDPPTHADFAAWIAEAESGATPVDAEAVAPAPIAEALEGDAGPTGPVEKAPEFAVLRDSISGEELEVSRPSTDAVTGKPSPGTAPLCPAVVKTWAEAYTYQITWIRTVYYFVYTFNGYATKVLLSTTFILIFGRSLRGYFVYRSRRRRGCHVDIPQRRVAATPRPPRGYSLETKRSTPRPRRRSFGRDLRIHSRYGRVDRVVFIGGDSELVPRGPRGGSVGVRRTLSRYRCGHVRDADFVNRVRRHPCNHW